MPVIIPQKTPTIFLSYCRANADVADSIDNEIAKTYFEEALRINPDEADAHYNLAVLFENNFKDSNQAKKHYVLATQLDPTLIDEEDDTYYGIKR